MLRMARIVSPPRPLKGLQKQRGFALQTVALLNEELLLFIEEPERGIFLLRLHVVGLFFFKISLSLWLYLRCISFLSVPPGCVGYAAHLPDVK